MKTEMAYSADVEDSLKGEDWNEILLMTPAQLARAWEISSRKLWSLTASGEIPHIRIGRCVRYPVDDLQRWIDEQKQAATRDFTHGSDSVRAGGTGYDADRTKK